jgi:hypothetical protein
VKPKAPPHQRPGATTASLERPALAGASKEATVELENAKKALAQVRRNKGAPGISQLLAGTCKPQPEQGVEIPRASGGLRSSGLRRCSTRFIRRVLRRCSTRLSGCEPWSPTPDRVRTIRCVARAEPVPRGQIGVHWRARRASQQREEFHEWLARQDRPS